MEKHHDTLLDNEFHHIFLSELKVPLHHLQKQESEVAELKLIPIPEFEKGIKTNTVFKSYVPKTAAYYQNMLDAVKAKL